MTTQLTTPIRDDDEVVEVPLSHAGVEYVLTEPSAEASSAFISAKSRNVRLQGGQITSFGDVGELPFVLLQHCVKFAEDKKPVKKQTLKTWSHKFLTLVYDRALDLGDLRDAPVDLIENMKEAFKLPDSPVSYEDMQEWANGLDLDKFRTIRIMFGKNSVEKAGNDLPEITDGTS